jgi:uncharacterized protein YecE (DUF72 family)
MPDRDPSPAPELPFPPRPAAVSPPPGLPALRIGTSGFSYPDWRGPFYPDRFPDRQMLDYYAHHFAALEINSTYYHIPSPRTLASLVKRAEGRLEFAVKAHQDITHAREQYASALPAFKAALAPIRDAGRLGCVLLQFPGSFRAGADQAEFLRRAAADLAPDPVAVEFRHESWITEETFELLRAVGLAYCCVDAPRLPGLPPPAARATAPVAYVRFHGRNAESWRRPVGRHARYDYLYTEDELRGWLPKLRALAAGTDRCYAFFNNHVRGQAITNARMLAQLVAEP